MSSSRKKHRTRDRPRISKEEDEHTIRKKGKHSKAPTLYERFPTTDDDLYPRTFEHLLRQSIYYTFTLFTYTLQYLLKLLTLYSLTVDWENIAMIHNRMQALSDLGLES
jgi:hypothetical protein